MSLGVSLLVLHNFYQQHGGEDESFRVNCEILKSLGCDVHTLTFDNKDMDRMSDAMKLRKTIWNGEAACKVEKVCHDENISILIVHNFFPLASPAIYCAARRTGAKVIQWLHNYRLMCPAATFYKNGRVCETCMHKWLPWPAVLNACYRHDPLASSAVVAMLSIHMARGTWMHDVDRFVALTEFGRDKFVEAGFPSKNIRVIPNHLEPDPGMGCGGGGYGLFVGRLSEEKGIGVLLNAAARLPKRLSIKVVGCGPLEDEVRSFAASDPRIEMLGPLPFDRIIELMREADFLAFPSLWYEGMPRTIIEALAVGVPVIASQLGAMETIVEHRGNGLHFPVGNAQFLTSSIIECMSDITLRQAMREKARATYKQKYTQQAVSEARISMIRELLPASNACRHFS